MAHGRYSPVAGMDGMVPNFKGDHTLGKVVEALFDNCSRSILQMHDFLHWFGTGMDIMELKLAQEIYNIDQDLLFLVFMDLRKAYDTLDQEGLLITLEGYGAGLSLC